MIGFLKNIFLFISLILLIIIVGLLIPSRIINENIHYSIYDKHKLLEKQQDSKRLIFIGGSNLTFGLYSPSISDSLKLDVINCAIHAGYGLKYIIDDVKPFIKKNDVVVLIPEYEHYLNDAFWGQTALLESINVYPNNINKLDYRQSLTLVKKIPRHALKKIMVFPFSLIKKKVQGGPYHRSAFNKLGDITAHWEVAKKASFERKTIEGPINEESIHYIKEFSNYLALEECSLFISFPSLCRNSFNSSQAIINSIFENIKETKIPYLGSPDRYSFPDSMYFDSYYHLHKEAQLKRSNLLIEDLKNKLY